MTKNILKVFFIVFLIGLIGCTSRYQMDLAEQRRLNLTDDMASLNSQKPVELPDPLRLDDAVRIGLDNNLEIRISRIMAELADDKALSEKLKILPQLSFSGDISRRSDDDLKEYENLDTGEKSLGRSISEERTRKMVNLSLSWNVLDFGLSFIRARQAAMDKEIKRMERLRQAQNLAMDIAASYRKAVMAELELNYIEKIESDVHIYKEKAKEMVSQNRLDPISAKTIEKKMADVAITAASLQADISNARIELCRLMGLNPMTEFRLANESSEAYLKKIPESEEIKPEYLEITALNNRPEFFAADIQMRVQKDEARAALVSMFPGIRFDISNHYDDNKYLVNNYWSSVGLGVVENLLALPSRYVNWKSEEKNESLVKSQRLLLTAGVIVQVHLALHDFIEKEKRFRLYNDSYIISEDLLTMSRERYELGSLSDTVMTQQIMENMITRLERNRSLIDLINAYNVLLVTIGFDYSQWENVKIDMDNPAE